MKIKNLIAVAALLMGSTGVSAQGLGGGFAQDGLEYTVDLATVDLDKLTADVTLKGVSNNALGLALIEAKAVTTTSTVKVVVDGDEWTCTVVGISKTWETAVADASTVESVSFDCTNFPYDNDWVDGFANLTGLTIIDNEEAPVMDDAYFTSINFPATLETIDVSKMYGVKNIADNAFYGKTALESIALPAELETIGEWAFAGCTSLECDYEVPATMTSIGQYAFMSTGVNADFSKAEALATLGVAAFIYDTKIEAADLSKTALTTIEASTFEECSALATVNLAGLSLTSIGTEAFNETAIASITIPATVTAIGDMAFLDCTNLATVTFDGDSECAFIGTEAFKNTIISSFELPKGVKYLYTGVFAKTLLTEFTIIAGDPLNSVYVDQSAFESCAKLKTFNFVGADAFYGDNINFDAFVGCIPLVTIYTPQEFIDAYGNAPKNCKWEAKAAPVKVDGTIAIKNGFAKWFQNAKDIAIDAEKYKVFSVYVDNGAKKKDGTAYFQGLKKIDGRYYIDAKMHVIIQPLDAEATEVEYEDMTFVGLPDQSVLIDDIFTFDQDYTLADFQTNNTPNYSSNWALNGIGTYDSDMYVYRLTNNNGIGFRLFTGTTMKGGYDDGTDDTCANAQFFIQSIKAPDAAGRLNVVWLDEDGNVIDGEATAIQSVEKAAAEEGAIYNLQGVRVSAAKKGLYIQNGKKFIVK